MARRAIVIRRSEIDLAYVSACVGSLVMGAILVVANMTSIIGIIVVGVFMIFDSAYLVLFNPWIIFSVIYLAVMATIIAYRLLSSPTVIIAEPPPANHGRPFSPVLTPEPGRQSWWPEPPPAPELDLTPIGSGFADDRTQEEELWYRHLLAAPGRGPTVCPPSPLIWMRAANGLYQTDCAGRTATIQETAPDQWSWLVSEADAVLYRGLAPSFSQAEETIRALLKPSR